MERKLPSRSVIITGAARGIGRATALCLAKAGYHLSLVDLLPEELEQVATIILQQGGEATVFKCSVTDKSELMQTVNHHATLYGGVGALINCAGIGLFADVEATSPEDWRRLIDVNLTGTFLACQTVLPWMKMQREGDIINVISIAGKQVFANQGAYCASKWGALGFTRVLATEVRSLGIRVTALCPGAVNTPFWKTLDVSFDPLRMLQPQDVADTIKFLLAQPPNIYIDEIEMTPSAGLL